ncbi:armadillo repeat containing 1, like [Carcharodon carcharias]|uniref:armadillo repeat containing 1, like n=1 Tax=Carcharodon carcharias TaxID=13397 RepID=UPI001B7DD474|nr:armadillo repeat containing 1, like [Carcharodon carcharias]XP_041043247.1 armadillo repeat containing 1, like [Carcharodon carcharias]XP_041043248.1 armadillo repeat containing 1, like [Carcharodon carcharias]XP_041043249.1 armadillo repeat containing 1, like [Carcharodon carcharias]
MACKMMDALSVVSQLASEPQNREAIVKDKGCLPGLVLFLDHCNPQVLHCALQALRYLAECPSNREIMKNELGMMSNLERLQESRDHTSEGIRILATEIYELLKKPMQTAKVRNNNFRRTKKMPQQFFINSTNKRAKTITLQIDGLHNMDNRNICEEALLQVNGVISFTFQMALQRCVIRIYSDLKIESLVSAIATTKILQAHQVVKNESGEEVVVPLNTGTAKVEQNLNLPDYLPEDESPEIEHNKAISQTGAKGNTNGTWLSAAANFLTKTFYW